MAVDPREVKSPKSRLHRVDVLYEGEGFAIAHLFWDGQNRLGIRWNGKPDDPKDKGTPQSRGLPTWFVLPEALHPYIVRFLEDQGVDLAKPDLSFLFYSGQPKEASRSPGGDGGKASGEEVHSLEE